MDFDRDTASDIEARKQGYYVDSEKADAALEWIEFHLSLQKIHLYKWQWKLLYKYFSWRSPDGGYRFTKIYCWIPKSNGKSWLISIIFAYKLFELQNTKLYSVAVNSNQAKIILDGIENFCRNSPTIKKIIGKRQKNGLRIFNSPARKEVLHDGRRNIYKSLSSRFDANDGIKGNVVCIDEIHRMPNHLIDIALGAVNKVTGALLIIISTAGNGDKNHRSWQKYDYTKQVLDGKFVDVSLLPVIYEAPEVEGEAIYSIDVVKSCNPVLSDDPQKLADTLLEIEEAKQIRNDTWWRRHILNHWLATDGETYIGRDTWEAAEVPNRELEGAEVFAGIDRGGTGDFTGLTLFHLLEGIVYQEDVAYLVEDRRDESEEKAGIDYEDWIKAGELVLVPADAVMDAWVTDRIKEKLQGLNVLGVACDPQWAAYQMETLKASGYAVYEVSQNGRQLAIAIDEYAERIRQKRIVHPANKLFAWQLENARRISTSKDGIKIVKAGSNYRGKGGKGHHDNVDSAVLATALLRAKEIDRASGVQDAGAVVYG